MRVASGNYPEVWVGYRMKYSGDIRWRLVEDVHSVELAIELFKQNPPTLDPGQSARVIGVHLWHNARQWEDVPVKRRIEWTGRVLATRSS